MGTKTGKLWDDFLRNENNCYAILQLNLGRKNPEEKARRVFSGLKELERMGLSAPRMEQYTAVYHSSIPMNLWKKGDVTTFLENLYEVFNVCLPDDFTGHSMSVGDVVAVKVDGEAEFYFVDYIGFTKLDDFCEINDVSKEYAPLYRHNRTYASAHDELQQYRASYKANVACKEAIERFAAENYVDNHFDSAAVIDAVHGEFSMDRIAYVLANTIQYKKHDGRICSENKEWASTIEVVPDPDAWGGDRNCYLIADQVHSGLLDLLATYVRKGCMTATD